MGGSGLGAALGVAECKTLKDKNMRNSMAGLLMLVLSSGATAAWVAVSGNEKMTGYADPATMRKSGNTVKMWELHDQKNPGTLGSKSYQSIRTQTEFDCVQEHRDRDRTGVTVCSELSR